MAEIAVIKTGGKQYKVMAGDELLIEKILHKKGDKIEFADILHGKRVKAVMMETLKGPKVKIFKFKSKARYSRRLGHRQEHSKIKIESIS